MKKAMKGLGILLVMLLLIPFFSNSSQVVYGIDGMKVLDEKKDVDLDKSWTITLSKEVDESTVNSQSIQVLDEQEVAVPSEITVDKITYKEIYVRPLSNYQQGKKYHIQINSSLKSQSGKNLPQITLMHFVTKSTSDAQATIKKVEMNLGGKVINIADLSFQSTGIDGVKSFRIGNTSALTDITQSQRFAATSDEINLTFYSSTGDVLGTALLNVKDSNGKMSFTIDKVLN